MADPAGVWTNEIDPVADALRRKVWPLIHPKSTRTHRGFLLRQASDPVLARVSSPAFESAVPVGGQKSDVKVHHARRR